MFTKTCDCGTITMTFTSLTEKDFPRGWKTDCCLEALANAPATDSKPSTELLVVPEPVTTTTELPPTVIAAGPSLRTLTVQENAFATVEGPAPSFAPEPSAPKPGKRGRKSREK